ncbi:MAG TPA: acyltransferase domain-containing protein [Rugosimonospora sp.]|nr:acyltransferase domain-containing protein [Rugosimonospora sp.]
MDGTGVPAGLELPAEQQAWLAGLAALGPPEGGVPLPDGAEAARRLSLLDTDPADAEAILRHRPEPGTPLWWLLERAYHELVGHIDTVARTPPWRRLPDALGPTGAQLYSWLLLAALPAARENHARRGVPDDASWVALRDFGRQARLGRILYGHPGLAAPGWLALHFRGTIFELGRLQFQRFRLTVDEVRRGIPDATEELPVLDVHIPASGPLTPARCDASFADAVRFFPRHFPQEPYQFAVCTSWLLDDQLAAYLPADSNILAFQRRFELLPWDGSHDDRSVVEFVFRRPRELSLGEEEIALLPQETSLQRGIVRHLRDGGHWRWRSGWLVL